MLGLSLAAIGSFLHRGAPPQAEVIGKVQQISRAFPPAAGGSPVIYAIDLFSLLLISFLAAATIVRLVSRTLVEHLPCNHPVYYHRCMVVGLLTTILIGAFPNTLISMAWGEVSAYWMGWFLLLDKVTNSLTPVPFLAALTVKTWACRLTPFAAIEHLRPIDLQLNDLRATWSDPAIPIRLTVWCAFIAAFVSFGKWVAWVHG